MLLGISSVWNRLSATHKIVAGISTTAALSFVAYRVLRDRRPPANLRVRAAWQDRQLPTVGPSVKPAPKKRATVTDRVGQVAAPVIEMRNGGSLSKEDLLAGKTIVLSLDEVVATALKAGDGEIGRAIAHHWLIDASSHIFADPARSLLEPVVNAVEAGLDGRAPPIGKFGTGFLALCRLLFRSDEPPCTIRVVTAYREGGELFSYVLELKQERDGRISASFSLGDLDRPGTQVEIRPAYPDRLSIGLCENFRRYLHYLQFYPFADVRIDGQRIGKGVNCKPVEVEIDPACVAISDQGSGITLNCTLTQLLVPTRSSKTPAPLHVDPRPLEQVLFQGKQDRKFSYLIATVGDVVVLELPMRVTFTASSEEKWDYLLSFPIDTPLVVARNAIEFTRRGCRAEQELKAVIRCTDEHYLYPLYYALRTLEETLAPEFDGVFTDYLREQVELRLSADPDIIAVPPGGKSVIGNLIAKTESKARVMAVPPEIIYGDYHKLEEYLLEEHDRSLRCALPWKSPELTLRQRALRGELVAATHVIFVDDQTLKSPSHLGLRSFLFVPIEILRDVIGEAPSTSTDLACSLARAVTLRYIGAGSALSLHPSLLPEDGQGSKKRTTGEAPWGERLKPFYRFDRFFGQTLSGQVAPLLELEAIFHAEVGSNSNLGLSFGRSVNSLLHLYDRYFSIPDAQFRTGYGGECGELFSIHNAYAPDYLVKALALAARPATLERLIRFTTSWMQTELDTVERDRALKTFGPSAGLLGVPVIGQLDSPVAGVAELYSRGVPLKNICCLVETVNTPYELCLMVRVLRNCLNWETIGSLVKTDCKDIRLVLMTLIRSFLQKRLRKEEIRTFAHTGVNGYSQFVDPATAYIARQMSQDQHLMRVEAFISHDEAVGFSQATPFSIHQLLRTHLEHGSLLRDRLREGELGRSIELVRRSPTQGSDPQIVQAINHGGPRDPVQTMIEETLQNAYDAIAADPRFEEGDEPRITFKVEWLERKDGKGQLILEIHDPVGMASEESVFTDLLVPSFSRKKSGVGKMGNGFFAIFGGVSQMTIKTRLVQSLGKLLSLKLSPKRHGGEEVSDIAVRCAEIADETFSGTTIRVLLPPDEVGVIQLEALRILELLRTRVASGVLKLSGERRVQLELVCGETKETLETLYPDMPPFRSSSVRTRFEAYRLRAQGPGVLLTGGIPSISLSDFLVKEGLLTRALAEQYCSGWTVLLPQNSYEPTQGRVNLSLKPRAKADLKVFIADWLYYRGSLTEVSEPGPMRFPHYNSEIGDFQQVRPGGKEPDHDRLLEAWAKPESMTLWSFYLYYRPACLGGSHIRNFAEWIDYGYKTLVPTLDQLKKKVQEKLNALSLDSLRLCDMARGEAVGRLAEDAKVEFSRWREEATAHVLEGVDRVTDRLYASELLNGAYLPWFERKLANYAEQLERPSPKVPEPVPIKVSPQFLLSMLQSGAVRRSELGIDRQDLHQVRSLVEGSLSFYCKRYFELLRLTDQAPKARIVYSQRAAAGWYASAGSTIFINLKSFPLSALLDLLLDSGYGFSNIQGGARRLFLITAGKPGTLNHELEHARTKTQHGAGSHDDGVDVNGQSGSFDSCATGNARAAHERGLLDELAKEFGRQLAERGLSTGDIRRFAEQLRTAEKDKLEALEAFFKETATTRDSFFK